MSQDAPQGRTNTVLIPSRSIPKYFPDLAFPVSIYAERSNRIERSDVTRDQLMTMIHRGEVIARGTKKRVRRLEFCKAVADFVPKAERTDPFHGGDSNRLTYQDELSNGPLVTPKRYTPEGGWDHWDDDLTFSELRAGSYVSAAAMERRAERRRL